MAPVPSTHAAKAPLRLSCHWYDRAPPLVVAATVNAAVEPKSTVWLTGWAVMVGPDVPLNAMTRRPALPDEATVHDGVTAEVDDTTR